MHRPITVEVHSANQAARAELIADVRAGLTGRPKELPPRWFYDERGGRLFEEITRLPEYYQTRAEAEILEASGRRMVELARPSTIVDLGAGSSAKTRMLIAPARAAGSLTRFVPFDVSEEIIQRAARDLITEFPGLEIHAVIGEFAAHLDRIPRDGRRLIALLGGTVGNFDDQQRARFLAGLRGQMAPQDTFLMGVDLIKDPAVLVRAYDDAAGVTAEFNKNMLRVVNQQLGADFDLAAFDHLALYDQRRHRVEMHLRSRRDQMVAIPGAAVRAAFDRGETLRTEICVKFTRPMVEASFAAAGLRMAGWYQDRGARFALALAIPA